MLKWRKTLVILLAVLLLLSSAALAAKETKDVMPFTDVPAGIWYEDGVKYVWEKGLMTGTDETTFSPELALNRAQLVTILWRHAGEPAVDYLMPFNDVKGDEWYAEAVRWTVSENLVDAGTGQFRPGDAITREEASEILLRYTGSADPVLETDGDLTRAKTAVMLMRMDGTVGGTVIPNWSADSPAMRSVVEFVTRSVDETSDGFIPEKDRIAVFDMDGTLTCETFYTYYDTMMFIEYCLNDHPERVSDELKQVAASIRPGYLADEALARNFAKAYAGMTIEEFYQYAVEFGQKKTESFDNVRYIYGFYLPMAELVKYLYEDGFTIYVISGTERTTSRAIVANSPIRDYVTPNHVIGTDFEVKQLGHETQSSNMDYKYENGDELVLTGGFVQKNLNANKSIYIEREIGQRPVLAFGNSGSDTSMLNYTIDSRNPYPAQAYMVVADDNVREWGTQDWAQKSAEYIAKGYVPISMKDDFARIYPEGITRAAVQYQKRDWSDAPWYQRSAA